MRNLSGLRLARGYALFVPACVPRNSSPPPRCATHCPIFSSIPPQPQYSQNSSVPTSIPLMPDPCGSPDRGKSSPYASIELQILGNKPAGRRTGHRQIGTLKKKIKNDITTKSRASGGEPCSIRLMSEESQKPTSGRRAV